MLMSEIPQLRPQNDFNYDGSFADLENCSFLPANFYPIQTPGYTVHWSERELKVVERIGEGAKIVLEMDVEEINTSVVFDLVPKHERRRIRNSNKNGFMKNLTGWFRDTFNWSKTDPGAIEPPKITQVIPLMHDKTIFDLIIVLKRKNISGFVRMRLLMTGSFKNVQRIDAFIPAIESAEMVKIVNWKSLLVAVERNGVIRILDLDESEAEWRKVENNSRGCDDVIVCEDKYKESALLLIQNGKDIKIFDISDMKVIFDTLKLQNDGSNICGYVDEDYLYVIQSEIIYKKSLSKSKDSGETKHHLLNISDNLISYLVPWRQDFQVSALMVYISPKKLTVMAINDIESIVIHESEEIEFENEIVSIFVSSSLEIFLLDRKGNVQIYSGLLLKSDWEWQHQQQSKQCEQFEFSHWFNILGDLPFRSFEFYSEKRKFFNETLFIDDLLAEYQISFPPTDWKSLGLACSKLKVKVEIVLYYLLASNSRPENINSFYYNFGLNSKQVAFIETCFYADHGDTSRAVKIFCSRKMEDNCRKMLVPKLVKYLKNYTEDLVLFSLFSAGRLISIDLLISDEFTFNLMLESILNGRGVPVALEWIKGLFAWLRPDDQCALIPVASLHQLLLKKIINILLGFSSNSKFKSLGRDFVQSPFDSDTLQSILDHLDGEGKGDRAAWMITMLCASRGRFHRYLLDYNFDEMVKDEEVLEGIRSIKAILEPLVKDCDADADDRKYENFTSSPVIIPGSPTMNRSNSMKSISQNSPKSKSQLVNVYARTPSSPQPILFSSPNSPTFTPKHFPPKKPTRLSSNLRKNHQEIADEEEEIDLFKNDLIKVGAKRIRDEILELKNSADYNDGYNNLNILTKSVDNQVQQFESVIKIEERKQRKNKRRRT